MVVLTASTCTLLGAHQQQTRLYLIKSIQVSPGGCIHRALGLNKELYESLESERDPGTQTVENRILIHRSVKCKHGILMMERRWI